MGPKTRLTPQTHSTSQRTLLIVDDEEGPRETLSLVFHNDYEVLLAEHGYQAMDLIQSQAIDVVILDLRMPMLSGIEVLNRIKQSDPTIEVIILTAYETLETARQALRLGACDYLSKPFDIETIRHSVGVAMERRAHSGDVQVRHKRMLTLQDEIENQKLREEINRTQGEIYASIIHDLNGPLTVVSGLVELLHQTLAGAPRIEGEQFRAVRDRVSRIQLQVNNCVEISRRYLSLLRGSRSQESGILLQPVLNNLRELLRSHPDLTRNELVVQNIPGHYTALINPTDLLQILVNLTVNALQSSPDPHRVEVACECLQEPIPKARLPENSQSCLLNWDGFDNKAPIIRISVKDTGCGISSDALGKIFEPYYSTKSSTGQGTGIGLAIVRRLVDQAKGMIHVQTEPGRGTAFHVYLPSASPS